jgi:hypothetical protein
MACQGGQDNPATWLFALHFDRLAAAPRAFGWVQSIVRKVLRVFRTGFAEPVQYLQCDEVFERLWDELPASPAGLNF